jgi:pimeloyl-ACP methyl ester carboxylesterase
MIAERRRTLVFEDGAMSFLEWEGPAEAPLLLFLHANGFNALTYRTVLAPLAGTLRVIAFDLRGHGLTTLPTDLAKARWTTHRDDLLRFTDKLGAKAAVLSGHSMGAIAGLMAAAMRPGIADALVLAEPVMLPDSAAAFALIARRSGVADRLVPRVGPARRRRARFATREQALNAYLGRSAFRTWPEEAVRDYVEGGLIADGDGFRLACPPQWEAELFSRFPFGLARLANRISAPVAILAGSEHSTVNAEVVNDFVRRNGRTEFMHVPGASHFLPLERPDVFRAAILQAVERVVAAAFGNQTGGQRLAIPPMPE